MRRGTIGIQVMAFLLSWNVGDAAEMKRQTCYRMSGAVTLDGRLDEDAWKRLPEATGFFILPSPYYSQVRQTSWRLGWDDENVYLGVRCQEPDAAALAGLPPEKRGGWGGEALEIFFTPVWIGVKPDYFQFMIDANGRVGFAAKYFKGDRNTQTNIPDHGIRAAAAIGRNEWTMEAAIPLKLFGPPPRMG